MIDHYINIFCNVDQKRYSHYSPVEQRGLLCIWQLENKIPAIYNCSPLPRIEVLWPISVLARGEYDLSEITYLVAMLL